MTLEGTNTYLYGADPVCRHRSRLRRRRHTSTRSALRRQSAAVSARPGSPSPRRPRKGAEHLEAEVILPARGETHAGLRVIATPGHAADHVCFLSGQGVCFAGDLVLGLGSTIVPPGGGSLAAYMDSLALLQAEEIELIAPGHGPWITDPKAKLAEYVEHRLMRERKLLAALDGGERSRGSAGRCLERHPVELARRPQWQWRPT